MVKRAAVYEWRFVYRETPLRGFLWADSYLPHIFVRVVFIDIRKTPQLLHVRCRFFRRKSYVQTTCDISIARGMVCVNDDGNELVGDARG